MVDLIVSVKCETSCGPLEDGVNIGPEGHGTSPPFPDPDSWPCAFSAQVRNGREYLEVPLHFIKFPKEPGEWGDVVVTVDGIPYTAKHLSQSVQVALKLLYGESRTAIQEHGGYVSRDLLAELSHGKVKASNFSRDLKRADLRIQSLFESDCGKGMRLRNLISLLEDEKTHQEHVVSVLDNKR